LTVSENGDIRNDPGIPRREKPQISQMEEEGNAERDSPRKTKTASDLKNQGKFELPWRGWKAERPPKAEIAVTR
jgi:hypothetical protein